MTRFRIPRDGSDQVGRVGDPQPPRSSRPNRFLTPHGGTGRFCEADQAAQIFNGSGKPLSSAGELTETSKSSRQLQFAVKVSSTTVS